MFLIGLRGGARRPAYGEINESTDSRRPVARGDFSQFKKADFLKAKGKETPVFLRFSTVRNSMGSPETLRDQRRREEDRFHQPLSLFPVAAMSSVAEETGREGMIAG
jgi:hypothetical protein